MENSAKKMDDVIKEIGLKLKDKIDMPIIVGGWAMNLLGHARTTVDFDFIINEADYEKAEKSLNEMGYYEFCKTPMFARFEVTSKNSSYPIIDCLFVEEKTYKKLKETGSVVDFFGAKFILPAPINIIAMKLHAINYNSKRVNDFSDIIALIEINSLDVGKNSEFEKVCLKYSTMEMLQKIRDAVTPAEEVKKPPGKKFKLF